VNLLVKVLALIREALASAWSQRTASAITVAIVGGMCASVLLTTGRTVGAEDAVLSTLDSAGTRSIIVRADPDSGLTNSVLDRLKGIEGIEWVAAFGPARDVTNSAVPEGRKVPLRSMWGGMVGSTNELNASVDAFISDTARKELGMSAMAGSVRTSDGLLYPIAGPVATPDVLGFLEPLAVLPQPAGSAGAVSILAVVATDPAQVQPVLEVLLSVLDVADPTTIKLTTSETLADLHLLVKGQLGGFGRELVIVIFGLTSLLVAAVLYGLVMMRRKDFGRRRALGASRGLIAGLLIVQTAILTAAGALIGSSAAAVALAASGDPLPRFQFFAAIGVLSIVVGILGAIPPAWVASRRDPLRELRVP
jgi:putative ABC transport system permease protein